MSTTKAGVLSLALGRQTPQGFEMAATICGATLIVSAHILNMRLARTCGWQAVAHAAGTVL
jgi:hypothetical protein